MSRENNVKTLWLEEGLEILAKKGPSSLSIESLTIATGKTKGSFYHHFNSREQYIEKLLEYYEKTSVDEISDAVNQEKDPRAGLRRLTELTFQISSDLELAIRAWALYDPMVKAYRDRIDKRRLEHLKNLHIGSGVEPDKADILAYRDYSIFIGFQQLKHHLNHAKFRKALRGIYSGDL